MTEGMSRREMIAVAGKAVAGAAAMAAASSELSGQAAAQEPRKPRIKQGVVWGFCRNRPPDEFIKEAKAMGYQSFDFAPRDQWQRILDAGMRVSAVGGHASLGDGLNKRENHARIENELRANIEAAAQFQVVNLICFSGNRHGASDEEGIEVTAEGLLRVSKYAEEKGVNLVIELLNSKVDHRGYQCDHTSWGVAVCKKVNSPRVGLLYDIYHMQIMEGDLIRTIRDNIKYILHFHTAGNPGRRDPDDQQEIYYPAVMRAIADTGYQGYVTHEFGPKGDVLEAMRAAYKVCDV